MDPDNRGAARDWAATLIAAVLFLAFILAAALAPDALGAPIQAGGTASWGLLLGVLLVLFVVALSWAYMWLRNRADQADQREGADR